MSGLTILGVLLSASPGAGAAESSKQAPAENEFCGASAREAIAFAEKVLAEKRPEGDSRALACLLAAVKALEAGRLDVVRGEGKARVLRVPISP